MFAQVPAAAGEKEKTIKSGPLPLFKTHLIKTQAHALSLKTLLYAHSCV